MMSKEQWFPARESSAVVGRFMDHEVLDGPASRKAQKNVYRLHPFLQAKVAGSSDVSTQKVKPFNEDELKERFPGAWEHYMEHKGVPEPEYKVPVHKAIKGTPLHEADFLPRAKMPWLNTLGFSTVEQLAEISDTTVQDLGRGALSWRKKAKEFLART